jgi:dihydrofolate reductase
MRKLKLLVQMSLDGYIADAEGKTDWMIWNWTEHWSWDDELKKHFNGLKASLDCVLLSRKMAEEGFIDHWNNISQKIENPQSTFARKITLAHKVVFTKTLAQSRWPNTHLAKGDLAEEVNALKNQQGKDIFVYGGATFVSALIQAKLIDEYHFFVNPVVLGSGLSIFNDQHKLPMILVNAKSFQCGVAVLQYSPKN